MCFIVLAICFLCVWAYVYFKLCINDNSKVKSIPGAMPLFGHLFSLNRKDLYGAMLKIGMETVQLNDISKVYLGPHTVYVITDPDNGLKVLNNCLDRMFPYKFVEPIFGSVLITAEVPTWKRNRKILDFAFKPHILDGYLDIFNEQAIKFANKLHRQVGKGNVDLTKTVSHSVLESIYKTMTGDMNGKNAITDDFVKAVQTVFKIMPIRLFKPWLVIDFIFNTSSYGREFNAALKKISLQSERVLKMQKEEYKNRQLENREEDKKYKKFQSLLEIILYNSANINGCIFNDNEMTNLINNLLLAGFDTTTYQLLFILLFIGSHPDVQDKIIDEINIVMGKDVYLNKDYLKKLIYLEAVIKETIRLYPIAPMIARKNNKVLHLKDITIPPGHSILVHIWSINRHQKYWGPDADEFKPERWLNPTASAINAQSFSFSPGRRGCIGKSYAMIYLKTMLVPAMRKLKFTADYKKMHLEYYVMLKAKSGRLFKIDLRRPHTQ